MKQIVRTKDGKELEVSKLTCKHKEELKQFNESLCKGTREHFLPHSYKEPVLTEYCKRSEKGEDAAYLLWDNNKVVGYFFLWKMDIPTPILGIGIADEYQGRGLGKKLITILIKKAEEKGRAGIELTTVTDNEAAYQLYLSCGFEYLGDVENKAGDGRVVKERHMFLPLQEGAESTLEEHGPPL